MNTGSPPSAIASALRPCRPVLLTLLLAGSASAQFSLSAGPDVVVEWPDPVTLEGTVQNVSDLDYWFVDGNGASEDFLVKFNEVSGVTTVGPMDTFGAMLYEDVADLARIGSTIFGIDSTLRQLFVLDSSTGTVFPVGMPHVADAVHCLAYDPISEVLYGVDELNRQLVTFDLVTGNTTNVGAQLPFLGVRALAFNTYQGLLYGFDRATNTLFTIAPGTAATNALFTIPMDPSSSIEELDFFGELYAARANLVGGMADSAQLQRIAIQAQTFTNVGAAIPNVSPARG